MDRSIYIPCSLGSKRAGCLSALGSPALEVVCLVLGSLVVSCLGFGSVGGCWEAQSLLYTSFLFLALLAFSPAFSVTPWVAR